MKGPTGSETSEPRREARGGTATRPRTASRQAGGCRAGGRRARRHGGRAARSRWTRRTNACDRPAAPSRPSSRRRSTRAARRHRGDRSAAAARTRYDREPAARATRSTGRIGVTPGCRATPAARRRPDRSRLQPRSTRACSASRNWRNAAPSSKRSVQPLRRERPRHAAALGHAFDARASSASRSSSLRPGGATTPRQLARSSAMPDSRSVGASMPGTRSARRDGQHAQPAGRDLSAELAVAADPGGQLSAEQRGQRFAAAGERHVVDERLGGTPHRLGDQPDQQVIGAAGRSAAPRDAAGTRRRTRRSDLRSVADGRRRRDGDHLELAGQPRDRRRSASDTGESLDTMAPTMTRPVTSSASDCRVRR